MPIEIGCKSMERQKMIDELARLLPSARARAVYLRLDDAALQEALVRLLRNTDRVRRAGGTLGAANFGLRLSGRDA